MSQLPSVEAALLPPGEPDLNEPWGCSRAARMDWTKTGSSSDCANAEQDGEYSA